MQLRFLYLTSAILVVLDQISKQIAKADMLYGESIPLIGDFLRLTYVENPGMAFSINIGGRWFLAIFSLIASIVIAYLIYRSRKSHWTLLTSLVLILGGAVGNLIDRFIYGKVIDFIDVEFFDIPAFTIFGFSFSGLDRWPIFNFADSYVSVGMVLLIIYSYFFNPRPADATPPG
jgi:signal peptidase II